ncbi:M48 family metallopeptidase [Paracidobacterium acidisoli]|nr:M48 family metallopeptidase [Paracidobacterium acidisoli]MBT9331656.1 M48 family metallopeptidase [Paracidobacterium acidisoli]
MTLKIQPRMVLRRGRIGGAAAMMLALQTASGFAETTQQAGSAGKAVYTLPPAKLAKAIALSHARTALHFGGTLWIVLALGLLVYLRAGDGIRAWAAGVTHRRWLQGLLVCPVWLLALSLIGLPLDLLDQQVDRHFGLSIQGWPGWFGDWGKSLLLTLVFGTLALSAVYALMRHSQRRWWLWFWVISLPVEVLLVFLVPVVIDPLFNHFSPLAASDPALVIQLERVAARGHLYIPPERMFVMDASRKVTGLNAYVTGFGATKRIVVWDNTIHEAPADEILFIYGHEQGHYVLRHIAKGLVFYGALLLLFYWAAFRLMRGLIRRHGVRWRIAFVDDWASVGLLLLLITVLGFLAEPAGNAFSRWEEHQADVYGQEVIHGLVADPQRTAVSSFVRLGEIWLDNPSPSPFVEFWSYSHPSTSERAAFAAQYDPWQPGRHPKYFEKEVRRNP